MQKQIIIDTLKASQSHPSVDDLYEIIQKTHPAISKATVYRNVRHLARAGEILQIAVANDVSRYDGNTARHQHFICDSCGVIHDVHLDDGAEALVRGVESRYGHRVSSCATSFGGVCVRCKGI